MFNYALTPYLSRGIAMLGLALAVPRAKPDQIWPH